MPWIITMPYGHQCTVLFFDLFCLTDLFADIPSPANLQLLVFLAGLQFSKPLGGIVKVDLTFLDKIFWKCLMPPWSLTGKCEMVQIAALMSRKWNMDVTVLQRRVHPDGQHRFSLVMGMRGRYEYTISIQVADDKMDPMAYGWKNTHCPAFTIIDKQTNLQLA